MDGAALAEALGRAPGPWLGDLLTALREEQLVGAVQTPKDALRFSKEWMQSVET
jgi:hypothetical protein